MAFTLRLNEELEARLSEAARLRGITRSLLIEAILREWVLNENITLPELEEVLK